MPVFFQFAARVAPLLRVSRTVLRPVSRAFRVMRAARAEKESFWEIRESLPSAQAVVTAAPPRLEIRASFAMPPGLRTAGGSDPPVFAEPVTYTAPEGVRA